MSDSEHMLAFAGGIHSVVVKGAVHTGCHGFGVRDKAVSSLVERRESPIDRPMRIAPHDDIPPKMHGVVADSKPVTP